jgi:type I restriction enzyme S subunit
MASDWKYYHLSDLIEVKHGYSFKGEFFREEPTPYLLLTPGNFAVGGGFQLGSPKYYDGYVPDDFVLSSGELVITMTDLSKNSDTLGYPALVPEMLKLKCLHNQRLGRVVLLAPEVLELHYLYYVCCSKEYRDEILASASGTAVKHTAPIRIKAFGSYFPPLPEQRAISRILGALDDKIELNRRMNHTLESMAQALFKSWFVDFDPVTAKAEDRTPFGMSAEVAALFPEEFVVMGDDDFPLIPKGWHLSSLADIANYENGLALQKYRSEGIDFLPVIKIRELRQGYADENSEQASLNIKPSCILDDGDMVFSWSGSLMIDLWCGGKGALNQHLFKVTSEKYPKWLYYFWTYYHLTDFQNIAAGKATTMGHIQRHHLASATTVVPPDNVLARADRLVQPIMDLIVKNRVQSRTLASIRDALLPRLLSGEVRVKV